MNEFTVDVLEALINHNWTKQPSGRKNVTIDQVKYTETHERK